MPDTTPDTPDRYRTVDARFQAPIDPDANVDVVAYLTVDTVDADNEVVLPAGCDLGRFARNAPVMVCHDWMKRVAYYPLPVGQVTWTKMRPHGILGGIKFGATAMALEVKSLVSDLILRGVSIGMKVLEQSAMTRAEAESRPDWKAAFERAKGRINVIRKCILLELSVVPIPSNEDALIQTLKAKGLSRPAWVAPAITKGAPAVDDETKPDEVEAVAETPADEAIAKAPEPDEDDAEDDDEDDGPVRKGDFVKCVKGAYKGVVGKVKSLHRGGPVPDVDDDVMSTKEMPAARVCCYKAMGDGHKETSHHIGCKVAHVEKIDDLKAPKASRGKAVETTPADRAKAIGIEILPGEVRTDEEVMATRAAAVKAATSPETIAKMARSIMDEITGAV